MSVVATLIATLFVFGCAGQDQPVPVSGGSDVTINVNGDTYEVEVTDEGDGYYNAHQFCEKLSMAGALTYSECMSELSNPNSDLSLELQSHGLMSGDCDNADPDVYPGAPAKFDGKDTNCDGQLEPGECIADTGCIVGYCDASVSWQCVDCLNDGHCDNDLFCDGVETCDILNDCQPGTAPSLDDGVSCTNGTCDEVTDTVVQTADDTLCDDGNMCSIDYCDVALDCVNDFISGCCNVDADCATGEYCNVDVCEPLSCDDNNECTDDVYDSDSGMCVSTPIPNCCFVDADCLQWAQPGDCSVMSDPFCNDGTYGFGCFVEAGQTAGLCDYCEDSDVDEYGDPAPDGYCSAVEEICDDGRDGDRDGDIDCADSDCASLPICINCDDGDDTTFDIKRDDTGACVHTPLWTNECDPYAVFTESSTEFWGPGVYELLPGDGDGEDYETVADSCSVTVPSDATGYCVFADGTTGEFCPLPYVYDGEGNILNPDAVGCTHNHNCRVVTP